MTIRAGVYFQVVKYTVYALLSLNIFLWLQLDWVASDHTFADGVTWREVVEAFSATVDTAAWVVLLLLFELETYILPHRSVDRASKWTMHGLRTLCYFLIVYSAYGYYAKADLLYDANQLPPGADLCTMADGDTAFMTTLDEFELIDIENCGDLYAAGPLFRLGDLPVITDSESLQAARNLAWVDVVNAITWIFVVLLLEFDVWLKSRGLYAGRVLRASISAKGILYAILFAAAIYWGIASTFLDFWDAFLWLFAFLFIEMNISPLNWLERRFG